MITRIVKMHFAANFVEDFKILFEATKSKIASADGCLGVELFQDYSNKQLFFTISKWKSDNDLQNYRNSALFTNTWGQVKPNFIDKPEAYSLIG